MSFPGKNLKKNLGWAQIPGATSLDPRGGPERRGDLLYRTYPITLLSPCCDRPSASVFSTSLLARRWAPGPTFPSELEGGRINKMDQASASAVTREMACD